MAYTTINKPSDYFNTKLYAGNSGTQSITGVGFQPDFLWIKRRTLAGDHNLVDVIRTSDKTLISNSTGVEYSNSTITSFDSNGFSLSGSDGALNASGSNYASWNWKANGAGSSNTDGNITSTVSANTTSGFSIVKYTGNNTAGATVGHGLGVKPSMIIFKALDWAGRWYTYHSTLGATKYMLLNAIDISNTATSFMNNTEPTSSVFTLGTSGHVNDISNIIAYCFAEKKGYSKFGSYTGNGNADGTFIYTGFKPAFILQKRVDATSNWHIFDIKRDTYNSMNKYLLPNDNGAESTAGAWDFLSNGFKIRSLDNWQNQSGGSYIYMAFAKAPLVGTNGVTAKAR